jgi:hypothetical protein
MIRPWIGVLSVVVGLAALPSVAVAQAQDTTRPTLRIDSPADGATYAPGQVVNAAYVCEDAVGVTLCEGTKANGAALDTAIAGGTYTFVVNARDAAGNTASETRHYTVSGEPGSAPAVLSLTLGAPPLFAPFAPALDRVYTTTLQATIASSAANARLTVADANPTAPGYLVNGAFALAQPLQASGASTIAGSTPGAPAPVGAQPSTLLTYNGPVGNDAATISFSQAIAKTESLRTGTYSKTLTYTLTSTAP